MKQCALRRDSTDGDWNVFLCIDCGRTCKSKQIDPRMVHRPCSAPKNFPPGWGTMLANFSLSAIKHVYAGLPTCTDGEIAARYEICQECHLYERNIQNPDVGRCTHKKCGCKIHGVRGFVSKIAWRDQTCPLDKWPKLPPT